MRWAKRKARPRDHYLLLQSRVFRIGHQQEDHRQDAHGVHDEQGDEPPLFAHARRAPQGPAFQDQIHDGQDQEDTHEAVDAPVGACEEGHVLPEDGEIVHHGRSIAEEGNTFWEYVAKTSLS